MVLSTYEKQRILFYYREGLNPSQIVSAVKVERMFTCRQTVARFIKRFLVSGTIAQKEGSGRPSKITNFVLDVVDHAMRADDETTATQLGVFPLCLLPICLLPFCLLLYNIVPLCLLHI